MYVVLSTSNSEAVDQVVLLNPCVGPAQVQEIVAYWVYGILHAQLDISVSRTRSWLVHAKVVGYVPHQGKK